MRLSRVPRDPETTKRGHFALIEEANKSMSNGPKLETILVKYSWFKVHSVSSKIARDSASASKLQAEGIYAA